MTYFEVYKNYASDIILSHVDKEIIEVLATCKGSYIGGGALRSVFDNTPIKDYDIFFASEDVVNCVLGEFLIRNYITVFYCSEHKLISLKKDKILVQLVTDKFYNSLDELVESFDLVPCCIGYSPHDNVVKMHDDFLNCVFARKIKINKVTYPLSTFLRIHKYIKYGYKIEAIDFLNYCKEVSRFDINDNDIWRVYID